MASTIPQLITTDRVEQIGVTRWTLQIQRSGNRWRSAWAVDNQPSLSCGCGGEGPPWHLHHCHQVKRLGGDWGWHREQDAAIRCAEAQLTHWRQWYETNHWWHEVE